MFIGSPSYSADIAADVTRKGANTLNTSGYLEIGTIAGYRHTPFLADDNEIGEDFILEFDIGGEYRYKRFFVEASQGTMDGINIGYTLWHNKNWHIDHLGASISGELSEHEDSKIRSVDSESQRNEKLRARDTFYIGSGVRITHYIHDYIIQYRLIFDLFDSNGLQSSLRLGRGWQIQNWNFHGILSAHHISQKTNDYWFGIDSNESTSRFPAFSAQSATFYSLRIGLARPLAENWVFRAYASQMQIPSSTQASPLVDKHHLNELITSINYVF